MAVNLMELYIFVFHQFHFSVTKTLEIRGYIMSTKAIQEKLLINRPSVDIQITADFEIKI